MKGLKDIIGIDYGKLQDELHKEMSESEQNTRERQEQAYMDEARRNAREFDLPARERTLKDDFAQGFGTFEPARRQLRKDEQVAENLSTDYMAYVGSKDVAEAANAFDLPEMQRNYAVSPARHVGIESTVDEKQRREVERPTHKSSEYTEARAVRPGERSDDGRIFRRTLGGIMPEARHDTFGFAKIAKSRRDNQAERLANNFNSLLEDAMSFEPGSYNTDQYRAKSDTIAAAEGNLRELVRRERDYDDKLYSFFDTDEGKRVARPILDKYSDGKAREAAKMYDIDEDTAVQRVTAEREKRLQEAFEGSDYYQKWLFGTQYGQASNALNKAQRLNAAKYLDVDTSKQQKDVDNMNLAQSIDESKDYYKQELDRLEKEAVKADARERAKYMYVDMLSGGKMSAAGAFKSDEMKAYQAAKDAYNDIAETQAEYLREGNTTALGRFFRGMGNAATDVRTWDLGFANLNDAVEVAKAAEAVENGTATKAQELLVNLSALKSVVMSEYGDVLGGMYGAGRTTTEMLPFMAQMIMTPTTGVVKAATGKIAGVLAKKMGKEAAEKAAKFFAEKLTGKVIRGIGKGAQKVAEATERGTVSQALYGMPTTLADTQERMTGTIKAGTSDDDKIVYTGRGKGDGLIDAARKSYIANNLERTTEMLGSLFRPAAQAMKRGVKAFTDYATKNGINLSKIYDFFAMTDKKGMVQIWDKFAKKGFYDGPIGEYGEEVINNLGNALLVGDLEFSSPENPNSVFNPEINFDTFLAVAMGSAFMGGLGRINYGWTIFQKKHADNLLKAQLDNWSSLKDELTYEATANDALKEGFGKIAYYEGIGNISHNQADALKKALANYANITWWQKGLDMREEKEQEAAEDTQADNTGTTAQDAATVDVVTAGQGEAVNAGQQPVQSPTDVLTSVNTESMPSAGEAVDVDPGREYRSAGRDFAEAEAELDARENSNDHNKAAAAQIIKSSSDLFTAQAILNERALDTEDNLALAERYFSSLERSKALEDEMFARANEETDNIIHKDTGSVVEVTDRDGNAGYVISGGVSVEDDGTVSATDDTVMVKSADGTVRQIPAVELQFTSPATSRDDYAHRLQARMQVRNDVPEPVAGLTFTDDDGIRHTVTGVDTAGNIVVSDDLGETTTISRDDYNYFMSNALDKQEEQAQAAGQAEVQPQESQPVAGPVTAGQPQNVEHSSTDVQETGENVPAVEKNVENIQQEEQTGGVGGRKLTGEEAEALVSEMETNAEIAPEVELTPDNWVKEFGENGIVDTPVGKVKIGENQYLKLLKNKRDRYFGMIKPTLTNPDVILEEYDPKEGAERDTKYLFIKTFVKPDGSRVVHFESVTVQKDNLEVSISSHEINEKALTKKVYQNNLIHLNEKFSSSEWRLTEPRNEGSDLVPTPNSVSSESKDNEKPEEIPTDGKGNLLYHEVPVEKTVAYLYNSGLTDEEIQGFIEANIAASREKYERSAQKQPKIGTDIAKYKAKKAQWRSSVDGAKKQYDYWQAVDTYIKEQTHTTEEEVSAARAELEGDNARREYASISGDIQGDAVVTAAQFISDKKITPESFRRETGYGKDEQRRFVGMIASKEKGGESIERLAERLAEDDADNNNGALYHGDDYNAKSAILDALQRYGTRGALKKGEDDMLADKYAEEKSEERDAHYMDAYHMDYADYLAAREQEMPDIWRKYGNFDKDEYYSLYAEEIEQRLKGIENEQRTDSEREEPADDRSDKVLPGERLDDGGGIAESTEPERKGDNGNGSPVPHGYVQEGSSAGGVAEKIAQAEAETDTNPTEAQKEAGNYKKGHVRIDGFDITIENPKGSVRSGVGANGKRWENTMNNTYGYMRGTEGVDGDHIDVFLSDNPEEGNVYVVDQQNPETGEFDEHKVMYGFNSMEEAKEAYLANYTPGWKGLGTITEVSKDEFKRWINSSHRKTKPFAEYKSVNKTAGQGEAYEATIRDAVVERLRESGIDVITDTEAGQRVLDEANGKQKISLETDSVPEEEHLRTVISSDSGAKVLKNIDNLINEYENSSYTKEKTFIGNIAKALSARRYGSGSEYATFETVNGKIVTIRLANHSASSKRMYNAGRDNAISIVISSKPNTGVFNDGKAHIVEFYYNAMKLRRAEGKPLVEILKSIKQALYSGEYKDTTGLAEVQEVNGETIREHRVYHGSGADFEAFDHSHMGEGEGARNYVIFDEKDLKITDHVRFFRTENGEAYGFTAGGKIYLDPRMATVETPIHEYSHLWASVLREANPNEWKHIAELLKGTPVWDDVKRRYPELETDDEIADEVLATYSGQRGAERLRDEARKIAEGKGSPIDKAEAVSALRRVREALQRFWKGVADFLHIHYTSAEDVADRVMRDLAEGVNPQKSSKGNMQNPAVEKIEDVGEKIGGARKDRFAEYMEKSKQVEDKPESFMEQLRKLPVSKMFNFPLDALRKDGLSNEAATLIDIIRRMIPAKPRSEWKLKRWTENVFRLYRMCLTLGTADKKMLDDILERIQRERIISGMYRAQMALGGFDSGKDTGTAMLEQLGDKAGHYDKNGEWVSAKGQWYVSHAGRYGGIYPDFEKAKEVLEKFAGENTKTSGSKKDVQFSIYMNNADKSCFITVKGKPDMVVQSGFKTAKDATNYLNEHIDDLREKYRNFKESTNIGFRPNGERIGKDWRGGKDVAAEDFRKAFGFRGVEFGNWTNQKERQSALNQAYDAFMDLSEATGISPQGLSLGGELGIAFGARGGGKAAAHYESGKVVINLTKTQGAGTLAHEWWHAIDNYFSRRRGHSAGYNTERRDYKLTREDGKLKRTDEKERTEITDAFGELMKAIEGSDYGKRSNRYASIKSNYWKDPTELGARAFAVWVERKLSEKGIVDDFLANNNTLGWDTPELTQKYFPYPMESDFESLDTAFDNLFNAIEEKTDEETGNTILYRFIGEKGAARLDAAEEANLQEVNERFNEELDKFEKGIMRSSDKFNLGAPSQILLSSGLPNSNIEMTQSVLRGHLVKHGISVNDIKNLPVALQNPIMVYEWGDKARSAVVITDLSLSEGRKVTVAIRVEKNGERLSINEISSIHGKEIERLLNDMNTTKSDFGKDNLKYVDKEKALNWFAMASPTEASQTDSRLDSAANIVKNFNNPEGSGGNLHEGVAEYEADKSPEAIARRNAERKERITGRVRAFAEENGLGEVDIIESADDTRVPDRVRREIEGGSVVSGWYDTRTGRVALYYPTVTDEADALRTVAHEAIGHKGLRAVIGEDTYNEFLDYVDRNADEDIAKRINAKESETGNRRVAVDEVLAEIAEREAGEPVHLNLWQRIAGWIRDALRRIGVDTEITVGQAQYYVWRSRRNAGKGGLTDTARDTVMRRKTKAKDVLNISAGMRTAAESEAEALQEVNKRFNEELSGLTEENADKVMLMLGSPSIVLRAAGVIDKPMKLYGAKVIKKMKKHGFALAELQNLPEAVANPIAVFNNYNKPTNRAILTELRTDKGNFLVTVDIGKGEKDIDFNIVSSVFGKSDNKIVNWINKGFATYINKEKALSYLHHSAPIAEALSSPELDSAANIINNFENPETGEENIRFRKSPRQRAIEPADNAVRTYRESAADLYHNTLERSMFRFTEAFQDGMRSVRVLVDSILTSRGESINDLKEYEDAYRAENHCASKSMNEFDQYRNRLYNPVIEAARRVMETSGLDTDGLRHYLFAKSGLERNREFTVRDIYKIADKANDEAQRRYATAKRKVEEAKASDEWKTLTGEEKKELELATSNAEKRADEKKAALDATEAIVNEYRELEEKTHGELENGYISFEEYCDVLDEFVTNNIDKDYNPAERDYSGFKSMFKGEADYKKAALALVDEVESRSAGACNDLWKKIKTATDYLLSKQAEGGLISHSQADMLKKRSNWYVPMRGWNGITTADVYDYVNNWNKTQGRRKEKEAGGRGSEAGDPIAQIIYIAQNTIEEANRNEVKQRFLDFVLNHMSDLATVHPAWVRLNEKGEWEYAAPDIEEGDSAEQIEQKIKTFEANMQAEKEAGRASRINSKARLNVDMVVIPRTEDEHTVLVRRGGRMFTIIINGNPRAAQALNGWLQRQQQGDVARVFNRAMRGIAMLITSKAPNFILRNGMRDFGYAADTLMVREGKDYAARFLKNYAAIIPAREHSIFKLLEKFKEGTLDTEHDDVERMFSEFMLNGAETGYINYQNVEKWRSDIENLLKKDPKGITEKGKKNLKKAWKGTWDYIEKLNRGAEDLVRFATYMTSRQEGRSIFTSVDNAKNVSVNFNRSGAGYNGQGWWRYPAGFMRGWFMFFNAGVQGLTNFLYNFKASPGRSTARAIARGIAGSIVPYFTLGFLNGLLHGLYGGDDGDDGKDGYFDLTDYTRRTNFIIGGFGDYYIMLPLPIELRAFYGAGEAFAGVLTGKQHAEDAALSAVASLFELLPVNPVEMYENPANLAGGVFSPIAQAVMNENFMGVPLYKDTPWNEEAPAYTKAYAGTPKILVDISRSINELTGGNEYKTGWLGKTDNVINNPAITYHLLRSYLGGVAQVFGQVFNLMGDYIVPNAETAITGEGEYNTDRIFREIPFFSVLVTQNDERTGYSLTNKLYHDMKEQADRRKDLLGKYFADGNKQEEINEMLEDSKANAKDDVILFYDGILKDLNEQAKGSTEEESEQIKITINKVRKAAVLNASEAAGEPLTLNMPQTRLQEQLGTGEAYIAEHMTIPDALEEGELRRLKSQASKNPNTIKNKITLTIIRRYESFKRKMSDAMEYSDDMGYNLNTIREARKGMLEYLRGM